MRKETTTAPIVRDRRGAERRKRQSGLTLGLEAFAKISAVEGLVVTQAIESDIVAATANDLSPSERSRMILDKYGAR